MEIKKVGVVGCGLMGAGIAQVCAQAGYPVVVSEINEDLLNKGLASIDKWLLKAVEKGKLAQSEKQAIFGRIKGTTKLTDFAGCDVVIEAIIEDMNLKKKVFAELDKICSPSAILSTNTSVLSVLDISMATKRTDKFLGLHFFNPAPAMKLIEIVSQRHFRLRRHGDSRDSGMRGLRLPGSPCLPARVRLP